MSERLTRVLARGSRSTLYLPDLNNNEVGICRDVLARVPSFQIAEGLEAILFRTRWAVIVGSG